jgi:hypothetical protein
MKYMSKAIALEKIKDMTITPYQVECNPRVIHEILMDVEKRKFTPIVKEKGVIQFIGKDGNKMEKSEKEFLVFVDAIMEAVMKKNHIPIFQMLSDHGMSVGMASMFVTFAKHSRELHDLKLAASEMEGLIKEIVEDMSKEDSKETEENQGYPLQ